MSNEIQEGIPEHSGSSRKSKSGGQMQPPLTPMIDVTFQLLIYFLVVTEFRKNEGQIPGSLPALAGAKQAVKPTSINIELRSTDVYHKTCEYVVDNRTAVTDPKALRATLAELKQQKGPDAAIVIRSGTAVRWKYCVEAFNAAVHNRFTKIGFGPAGM